MIAGQSEAERYFEAKLCGADIVGWMAWNYGFYGRFSRNSERMVFRGVYITLMNDDGVVPF